MTPGIDQLESRQMLSMAAMPVHGAELIHHPLPIHRAAVVRPVQAGLKQK